MGDAPLPLQKFQCSGFSRFQVLCVVTKKLCHDLLFALLTDVADCPAQDEKQHTGNEDQNTSGSVRKRPAWPEEFRCDEIAAEWQKPQLPEDADYHWQTPQHQTDDQELATDFLE